MTWIKRHPWQLLVLLGALSALVMHLIIITTGVYFMGDTTNYMEHALQGGLLTTFILHASIWEPGTALVFNVFHTIWHQPLVFLRAYVIFLNITLFAGMMLTVRELGVSKLNTFLLTVVALLVAVQHFIFEAAMSEILFANAWIFATYAAIKFIRTQREEWLFGFVIASSWLALTRYIGLGVAGLLDCLLVFYIWRIKKPQHSLWLILSTLLLSWMPLAFYLFKNKVASGSFFAARDASLLTAPLWQIAALAVARLGSTFYMPSIAAFLLGLSNPWHKRMRLGLEILCVVIVGYIACYVYAIFNYLILDNFPHRYLAPIAPFIAIVCFIGGAWCRAHLKGIKKIPYLSALTQVAVAVILFGQAWFFGQQYFQERQATTSPVEGGEYTTHIERLCNYKPNTYLLLHPLSRNWIAQSVRYMCPQVTQLMEEKKYVLPVGSRLITPYQLANPALNFRGTFFSEKNVYIYIATDSATIDAAAVFQARKQFE